MRHSESSTTDKEPRLVWLKWSLIYKARRSFSASNLLQVAEQEEEARVFLRM